MARGEQLEWKSERSSGPAATRRYRADAQILLLGVPLFRQSGVGGGKSSWSEGGGIRVLEFAGYSQPEHAAGLNRVGVIREMARTSAGGKESIYFGVMTASPEETAAEAQKALNQNNREAVYSAIEGRVGPGELRTVGATFTAPAGFGAARLDELISIAKRALQSGEPRAADFDPRSAAESTFLQELSSLLADPARSETRYIYNGRRYRLWLRRWRDATATAHFRERRAVANDATVARLEGKLRRESGGKETAFRLWVEESAIRPLPLRIDYQARSYLRLIFEVE